MKTKTKSARQIKQEKVTTLAEKISKAKTISFVNYHHLSAEQLATLRAKIKKSGGEFLVEKNSLIKLALAKNKLGVPNNQLIGPTAATFAYDEEISAIKEVAESQKELGSPIFKFGFWGSDLLDELTLAKLSQIPGRNILQANIVSTLSSPIYSFVNVLSANIRNLVSVLDQAVQKKGTSEVGSSV